MSMKETLLEDMKQAMKDKDVVKKNTVQMVRAGILQVEKDEKRTLDDDDIIGVVSKEVKKRKDSLKEYEKSGRQDLIDDLNREIEILMQYLPEQLTDEELRELVLQKVNEVGAETKRDIGKVMKAVMPEIKGRADGKAVNQILSEILN